MRATFTDDPAVAMAAAGDYLRSCPIEHNLILSIVTRQIEQPESGRYAWVSDGDGIAGFYLQAPDTFIATMTPMPRAAVQAIVEGLDGIDVPGVNGDAATAAMFAGAWAERRRIPVTPAEGMRLYSLGDYMPPPTAPGHARPYDERDLPMITRWTTDFTAETKSPRPDGMSDEDEARWVLSSRRSWLWDVDETAVSWVGAVAGAEHISRIGPVYTPPEHRGHGYAAACTGAVTRILMDEGQQPVLYTQLANPVSNGIYRRLGYEPVAENIRYVFG